MSTRACGRVLLREWIGGVAKGARERVVARRVHDPFANAPPLGGAKHSSKGIWMAKVAHKELSLENLDEVSGGVSQITSRNFEYGLNWPLGHSYSVMSDPFPAGTTRSQANEYLQRYNAPTVDAVYGNGNAADSTSGNVVIPGTSLSAGHVTFERGDGWVRNTTGNLSPSYWSNPVGNAHPLVGTITRSLVEDENGQFRIETKGEGQGGFLSNSRHYANAQFGPEVFQQSDARTLSKFTQHRQDGIDRANGENVDSVVDDYTARATQDGVDRANGENVGSVLDQNNSAPEQNNPATEPAPQQNYSAPEMSYASNDSSSEGSSEYASVGPL